MKKPKKNIFYKGNNPTNAQMNIFQKSQCKNKNRKNKL